MGDHTLPGTSDPRRMPRADDRPLIVHIVHGFRVGGLETGVVKLLNGLPPELARHCVLSLTRIDPALVARVESPDVGFVALDKRPGPTARLFPRLYGWIARQHPAIVHTRNLSTIECQLPAALARVPVRIHGEHGWDLQDLRGDHPGYIRLRRWMRPLIHRQVTVCDPLRDYLVDKVGIAGERVRTLRNGVDTTRFAPRPDANDRSWPAPPPWSPVEDPFVVGTVGRLAAMKNQRMLCEAFLLLRERSPGFRDRARLLLVGDGPDRPALEAMMEAAGAGEACWFAGEQADVAGWLRIMTVFCLPSLGEGMSNAVLEAMASALPVVALDVGANAEQVDSGRTGEIVSSERADDTAQAIARYFDDPGRVAAHGARGRAKALADYALDDMVRGYEALYAESLATLRGSRIHGPAQLPCAE